MKPYARYSPLQEVHLAAKLADLRAADYQHSLLLDTIIELLIEKNVLTREELQAKARQLDEQPLAVSRTFADDLTP